MKDNGTLSVLALPLCGDLPSEVLGLKPEASSSLVSIVCKAEGLSGPVVVLSSQE